MHQEAQTWAIEQGIEPHLYVGPPGGVKGRTAGPRRPPEGTYLTGRLRVRLLPGDRVEVLEDETGTQLVCELTVHSLDPFDVTIGPTEPWERVEG